VLLVVVLVRRGRRLALTALAAQRLEEVGRIGGVLRARRRRRGLVLLLEDVLVEGRRVLLLVDGVERAQARDETVGGDPPLARELHGVVVRGSERAAARVEAPPRAAFDAARLEGELDDPAVIGLPARPALLARRDVGELLADGGAERGVLVLVDVHAREDGHGEGAVDDVLALGEHGPLEEAHAIEVAAEELGDLLRGQPCADMRLDLAGARSRAARLRLGVGARPARSEEHTSELQSRENLVCRLLLEKKNNTRIKYYDHFELLRIESNIRRNDYARY